MSDDNKSSQFFGGDVIEVLSDEAGVLSSTAQAMRRIQVYCALLGYRIGSDSVIAAMNNYRNPDGEKEYACRQCGGRSIIGCREPSHD